MATTAAPVLPFTDNPEANRLLGDRPAGAPHRLRPRPAGHRAACVQRAVGAATPDRPPRPGSDRRHGPRGAGAGLPPAPRTPPLPGLDGRPGAALCGVVADAYGGDASRIWTEARDGADLRARLLALPSIGEMKVSGLLAILYRRFGVRLPGLEELLPTWPTLGDVDSPEALEQLPGAEAGATRRRCARRPRRSGATRRGGRRGHRKRRPDVGTRRPPQPILPIPHPRS